MTSWIKPFRGGKPPRESEPGHRTPDSADPAHPAAPGEAEIRKRLDRLERRIEDVEWRVRSLEDESSVRLPHESKRAEPAAARSPVEITQGRQAFGPDTPDATAAPPRSDASSYSAIASTSAAEPPSGPVEPPRAFPDAPPATAPAPGTRASRASDAARRALQLLDDLEGTLRAAAGAGGPQGLSLLSDARRGWARLGEEAGNPMRRAERKGDDGTWFESEAAALAQHVPPLVQFLDTNVDRTRSNPELQKWIDVFCEVSGIEAYTAARGEYFDPALFESVGSGGPPPEGDLRIEQVRERGFRRASTGQVLRKCRVVLQG